MSEAVATELIQHLKKSIDAINGWASEEDDLSARSARLKHTMLSPAPRQKGEYSSLLTGWRSVGATSDVPEVVFQLNPLWGIDAEPAYLAREFFFPEGFGVGVIVRRIIEVGFCEACILVE